MDVEQMVHNWTETQNTQHQKRLLQTYMDGGRLKRDKIRNNIIRHIIQEKVTENKINDVVLLLFASWIPASPDVICSSSTQWVLYQKILMRYGLFGKSKTPQSPKRWHNGSNMRDGWERELKKRIDCVQEDTNKNNYRTLKTYMRRNMIKAEWTIVFLCTFNVYSVIRLMGWVCNYE